MKRKPDNQEYYETPPSLGEWLDLLAKPAGVMALICVIIGFYMYYGA